MIAPDATTVDGKELLELAQTVVLTSFRLPQRHIDDATQTAALAGWENLPKWKPEFCSLRTFLWTRMRLRLIDWIRVETGRHNDKFQVHNPLSLDYETDDGGTIQLCDESAAHEIELIDTQETLRQLFDTVELTDREKDSIRGFLDDEPALETAAGWGTSRARVYQARKHAYDKLRAAA